MIWKTIAHPLAPVAQPHDPEGPLGDYAGLMIIHRDLFAMPRMDRANATIRLAGWTVRGETPVEWEGEPWWSGKGVPEPAARLIRDAPLYHFAMPSIDRDDDWVQTIRLDLHGIAVEIEGRSRRPSYVFRLERTDTGWTEACTVRLRHGAVTDLVEAIGGGDLASVLSGYGLRFAGPCPILDHRFHDDILEVATTTIVMAALRDDTQHHQGRQP